MLRKLFRSLVGGVARIAGALALLALVLPVALILYTTTDDFRARLLAYAVPELDGRMAGDFTAEGLEGSPLLGLRLKNAALAWHGEEIVRIPSATVALDWSALLAGRWRFARIELDEPRIVFKQHASLGWDWREALAPLIPTPDDPRPPRHEPLPVVIERILLEQATLRIEPLGRPAIEISGFDLQGQIDFPEKRIAIEHAALATGESKLAATGEVSFKGDYDLDVEIEALHPRELARISPTLAESLDFVAAAHGNLKLAGEKDRIDVNGQLEWPGAKLAFDLHGNPRHLTLEESKIKARLEVHDMARIAPRLALAGRFAAQIELDRGKGPFTAALLQAPKGELIAEGVLSLGEIPETELHFHARHFDLARALPDHPEWAGSLTGQGTLNARGRDRKSLAADVDLALSPSHVGKLKIRRGILRAKLAGDSIELAELTLESRIGRAQINGRLSTNRKGPMALKGRLDVDDLTPLLALARREGRGSLHARIDLDGDVDKARVASEIALANFRLDSFAIERMNLAFRARGKLGPELDAVFDSVQLETALGQWRLAEPARLRASSDSLAVESARVSNGAAHLALDGRLGRRGKQDFTARARALPIAAWARLFPDDVPQDLLTRGLLDLDLAVGGTAAAPILDLELVPRDLVISEKPIDNVAATLRFDARMARATLMAEAAPALRLDASAELPFELAWQGPFVARPTGPLAARADCEANDLAIFEPILDRSVDALGGHARCHLELAGPLDALRTSGEITASDLTGRPRRSGVTVVGGELAVELEADRFHLRQATATVAGHEKTARFRAEGDGPLPAFLTRFTHPAKASEPAASTLPTPEYTTKIEIEQWPVVYTTRDQLIASGVLRARGSLDAPHVEGEIGIVKGTLRPDLTFLSSGPPPRDTTIELENEAPAVGDPPITINPRDRSRAAAMPLALLDALELSVDVDLGRELWIKHELAEVLLEGRIAARKQRGKPLTLDGRIDAQRGFADLQGRRFRLIEGDLELVAGPKIDPILDVLGRYKAPAHTIDARLTGTASKPVLVLSSNPSLSQEDILAVLLFGRPAAELSQQQQTSVGQRAQEMASALGMTAVGRSLASAIGLEEMGLQIEELSSSRAAIGAYVGSKIFVALAQDFSGQNGQQLSIEYEFWPGWSVVGSTTSEGTNAADLVWTVRY